MLRHVDPTRFRPWATRALVASFLVFCACEDTAAKERAAYDARETVKSARWADTFDRAEERKRAGALLALERDAIAVRGDLATTEASLNTLADGGRDQVYIANERVTLAALKKRLREIDAALLPARRQVGADRDRLLALRKATIEQLEHPADGGPAEELLRARLSGVEKTLGDLDAALGVGRDGG